MNNYLQAYLISYTQATKNFSTAIAKGEFATATYWKNTIESLRELIDKELLMRKGNKNE